MYPSSWGNGGYFLSLHGSIFLSLIDEGGEGPSLPKLTLSLEFQVSTQPSTFLRDLCPSTPPSVLCPSAFKDTQNFTTFKKPFLNLMFPLLLLFLSPFIQLGILEFAL